MLVVPNPNKISGRCCPTFTTRDQIWHRVKDRPMLAVEKMAALGFPVTQDVANVYRVVAWIRYHGHAQL